MRYQFQIEEGISAEIIRNIGEELASAIEALQTAEDPHEGIHDTRKSLKKIRAILRLARSGFLPETFRQANETCRDNGRLLSDLRDATALIETLDKLREVHPNWVSAGNHSQIRSRLEAQRAELFHQVIEVDQTDHLVLENLTAFSDILATWEIAGSTFAQILKNGLFTAYRSGSKRFRKAYAFPTEENFHEWRKRVKDLWYHIQLLQACWPAMMIPFGEELHQLSGLLGDEHDLNVFHGKIANHSIQLESHESAELSLPEILEQAGNQLRDEAFPLGQKIYGEKPRSFVNRIDTYWESEKRRLLTP